MSNTLTLQRDVAASKIAAILLATGATLACFAFFGLARNLIFPVAGKTASIHPRAENPRIEVVPTSAITPIPEGVTEWLVPTVTPPGFEYQPTDFRGRNRSIPGCGTEADGIIRCWGGATPALWALLPGEIWEDANGNQHKQGEPVSMVEQSNDNGFRTGSGLRKDK